jgi:hypothetical protein
MVEAGMFDRLGPKAIKKLSTRGWVAIRPQFSAIHNALIAASDHASGELVTVYIKYTVPEIRQPFAVLWVKKSTELTLGLALPEAYSAPALTAAPNQIVYAGLAKYLTVHSGDKIPSDLARRAKDAVTHARSLSLPE